MGLLELWCMCWSALLMFVCLCVQPGSCGLCLGGAGVWERGETCVASLLFDPVLQHTRYCNSLCA
jgi:hypothetical protein